MRFRDEPDIAKIAFEWVQLPVMVDIMKMVMKKKIQSKRHNLFIIKDERERCNAVKMSKLVGMSNPGFIGSGGYLDMSVIKHIMKVFNKYIYRSDPDLQRIKGSDISFKYSSYVLFPECFIHLLMLRGRSREEADKEFTKIEIEEEEMKQFKMEIKMLARNKMCVNKRSDHFKIPRKTFSIPPLEKKVSLYRDTVS